MPERFIVEPWNAFSSLVFLIPVIFFLITLRGKYKEYRFLVYFALPLLFTGGIGSALYHAFRSTPWLMALDVFPMFVMTLGVSWYFMQKLFGNWYFPILILAIAAFGRWLIFDSIPIQQAINAGYFIAGLIIFVPALLYARITKWKYSKTLLFAAFFLSISLFFRFYDDNPKQFMAQGVHWLWHVFSAVGAIAAGQYIVKTNKTAETS
jgi:hemolysin III